MKKYTLLAETMTAEQRGKFAAKVAALPEAYQIAIRDSLAGKTQEEIAKKLKVSRVRVSQMVSRGLSAIAEVMNNAG
jgi:DNA-directed RNA polymerase specialized sigma subunit